MNTVIQISNINKGLGLVIAAIVIMGLVLISLIIKLFVFKSEEDSLVTCVCGIIAILTAVVLLFLGLAINDDSRMENIRKAIETEYPNAIIIDKVDYNGSFALNGTTYYYEVDRGKLKITASN